MYPGTDTSPLVLLARDQAAAQEMWDHLVRVGIDKVAGFVTGLEGLPASVPNLMQPRNSRRKPGSLTSIGLNAGLD